MLPSILVTQRLGFFDVVGGVSQSLTPLPSGGFEVASLSEAHLHFGDGQRLRAELQAYRRTSEDEPPLAGSGISLAYQISPTTSVRAWALRLHGDEAGIVGTRRYAEPYLAGESLWLTNENGSLRFDVIYRRTACDPMVRRGVDGDVLFPLSRRTAIGLRSELRPEGRRSGLVLTITP
ncbi:MAG: hypothetical protein JOY59_06475 [Candidatus Eremiobacteraeota bacterium]|nr:hypothetical protein [Candidatus Eremiobacteraeota bacterium]